MPNKVLLLSNVTMNMITKMNPEFKKVDVNDGYDTWVQYLLNPSFYNLDAYHCIIILLDGGRLFNEYGNANTMKETLDIIDSFAKNNLQFKIYLSSIDCYKNEIFSLLGYQEEEKFEYETNKKIYSISERNDNVVIFPLKQIAKEMGTEGFYSSKMSYLSSCPYSLKALKEIASSLSMLDVFNSKPRKKCLILDLDNTLWGGVIGEDGVEGIELSDHNEGRRFFDFQKTILQIKNTGIILAIVSKNNLKDVEPVFEKSEMLLKESDFLVLKIGWENKSDYIREIAFELNIGLDSMVFVDDNPVEREQVKREIPEVVVPDFPIDTTDLSLFGKQLYFKYFYIDKALTEDINKTEMYKANIERKKLRSEIKNIDDYIKSLCINLRISKDIRTAIPRIAQMTQKTNQFNLTTKRYSEKDIDSFISDSSYQVFTGTVTDKFGNNGMTILCIIKIIEEIAYIDEFLMSCRVMGRKIEYTFLQYVENILFNNGVELLKAKYIRNEKNAPAAVFYENYGFNSDDGENYSKKTENKSIPELMKIEYDGETP